MNSSQFKRYEFKRLCNIIRVSPERVKYILSNLDNFYKEKVEDKADKKTGNLKRYKDGTIKTRIINPPNLELKTIQRKINKYILSPIELPIIVHGGRIGKSNISNAKVHQGKRYILATDLQDFYPSISYNKVYETLQSFNFSPHFSYWLTKLITYKYKVPQGVPTSTNISNLVFYQTDLKLISLCKVNNITYTRYIDDLTFSSQHDFSHLINDILETMKSAGFNISYRKTQYEGKQSITGINVFPHKIDAPLNIIEKSKIELALNEPDKPYTLYRNSILKTNKKK